LAGSMQVIHCLFNITANVLQLTEVGDYEA
jgi:hypothetical protein